MITLAAAIVAASPATVTDCRPVDGDTLKCGKERIRLLGIDSPETAGHCRPGRACVAGDPQAATDSLRRAMSATMRIWRVKTDRYGRTVAMVAGRKGDLSCWQLRQGAAVYVAKWDNGGRVRKACGL